MKSLQDRVNLVPVIAKSDTLTRREVGLLKARVRMPMFIATLTFSLLSTHSVLALTLVYVAVPCIVRL